MENLVLNLVNGKSVNIEIVENKRVSKSLRGNWEAEMIIKIVESNEHYRLIVTKSYNGLYYACSYMIKGYQNHGSYSVYSFDVFGNNPKEANVYYFNGKIRATEKKVSEIFDESVSKMLNHLSEILD